MGLNMNLRDVYRATDVKRWGIVKVARSQSVAEHSFQVAMITSRLCDHLGVDTETRSEAVWFAMVHDLPEVITGDLATPLKEMLGDGVRRLLAEFEAGITILGKDHNASDEVRKIIKIADMIEAVAFLEQNAMTDHGRKIARKIHLVISDMGGRYGEAAKEILLEILYEDETTMDDIIRN